MKKNIILPTLLAALWMLPSLNLKAQLIVDFGSSNYLPGTSNSDVLKFNGASF
jgi:hypothetical protein